MFNFDPPTSFTTSLLTFAVRYQIVPESTLQPCAFETTLEIPTSELFRSSAEQYVPWPIQTALGLIIPSARGLMSEQPPRHGLVAL